MYHRGKKKKNQCKLIVYTPSLTDKKQKQRLDVFGVSENYSVPNLMFYCQGVSSRRYSLYQHYHKIHDRDDCFIRIKDSKQKLVAFNQALVLKEVVHFVNRESVFGTVKKVHELRQRILSNFESKCLSQAEDTESLSSEDLCKYLEKKVISTYYLQKIYDYLHLHVWYPSTSLVVSTSSFIVKICHKTHTI